MRSNFNILTNLFSYVILVAIGEGMKKLIEIKQEDIDYGSIDSPCFCPIALAIKRTLKIESGVWVDYLKVFVKDEEFVLPHAVTNFIQGFDLGLPVAPFEFELNSKRTYKDNAGIK